MSPDRTKQFTSKNAHLIPSGESVVAVIAAEPEGGLLRRSLVEAGSATPIPDYELRERARAEERRRAASGDAARWPVAATYWLVLTETHLHVFEGSPGKQEAGPGVTTYTRGRIARIDYRRRPLSSKLTVRFADGTSTEVDVGWQKVRPFLKALAAGGVQRRS